MARRALAAVAARLRVRLRVAAAAPGREQPARVATPGGDAARARVHARTSRRAGSRAPSCPAILRDGRGRAARPGRQRARARRLRGDRPAAARHRPRRRARGADRARGRGHLQPARAHALRRRRPRATRTTPAMLSLVVVHELVHALQHQHFPAADAADDRAARPRRRDHRALGAARGRRVAHHVRRHVAGRALAARSPSGRGRCCTRRPRGPAPSWRSAPRFLAISMVFPYADGTVLAAPQLRGGRQRGSGRGAARSAALDPARAATPTQRAPVEFVRLPLEQLAARAASPPCSVGSENTVGAHALRRAARDEPAEASRSTRSPRSGAATASPSSSAARSGSSSGSRAGARPPPPRRSRRATGRWRPRSRRARRSRAPPRSSVDGRDAAGRHSRAARAGRVAARRERGARLRLVRGVARRRLLPRARLSVAPSDRYPAHHAPVAQLD